MSITHDQTDQTDQAYRLVRQVTPILIRARVLMQCPRHRSAALMRSVGNERIGVVMALDVWRAGKLPGDRADVLEAIRRAIADAPWRCHRCDQRIGLRR